MALPGFEKTEGPSTISLNLTALMDILSNLLFFLLASYSVTATEIKGTTGIQLPTSTSEQAATMSILVRVTEDEIQVEDRTVATVKNGAIVAPVEEDRIVPLFDALKERGEQGEGGVKMEAENTVLLVLADKRVDYSLVSSVLKTAGYAGFPNFRFAVEKT